MSRKTKRNLDHNPDPARKKCCEINRRTRMVRGHKEAGSKTLTEFSGRHGERVYHKKAKLETSK